MNNSIKIVCLADTHMEYDKIKTGSGDILIHAGDVDVMREDHVKHFNDWLGKQDFKHRVVIGGNHDQAFAEGSHKLITNAIYLENSGCEVEGIKIWGSPQTPTFMDWFFMCDEDKIQKYWDQIPEGTDIIVTHGPPYKILDYVRRTYLDHHAGSKSLYNRIRAIRPKYHMFGHIHENNGIESKDGIKYVNCCVMNEAYDAVYEPTTIFYKK